MRKVQEIEKCVDKRDLREKETMLRSLYEIMDKLWEKTDGPCVEKFFVSQLIEKLLAVLGNSATKPEAVMKSGNDCCSHA